MTVILWASAFVGIRSAGHSLSPGALALGRLLVAAVVLLLIAAVQGELSPRRADVRAVAPALALCSLLWFAGYMIALNAGERRVDAGTAAMLIGIGPIVVAILAGLVLREGFPRALVAGCAVAFVGVVVIGVATSNGGSTATGVALCILAACSYAVAVILQKTVIGRLTALQTTLFCCVIAAVACLPFAWQLVRTSSATRARSDRLDGLPRRVPDCDRLHDLGVRPREDERGATRSDDLPGAAAVGAARLGDPVRDPTGARTPRRRPVPGRSRRHPPRRIAVQSASRIRRRSRIAASV